MKENADNRSQNDKKPSLMDLLMPHSDISNEDILA
jgi:hypothetical protein